ncbi:MAG: OPT/YSL family transporter [Myxococcota bacterium]
MSAARPYREVTPAAVILGVFLGAIMTMSFVYIGLKLGFGLPGSTVAAILGFAVLRGAGRRLGAKDAGSIVENNINQTVASGINTASSGVVFTFPALLLLGADFDPLMVIFSAIAGSFMGIVVIIPLRKQMLEIERLRFPSGVAVATILKTPGAGAEKAKRLAGGFAVAVAITLATNFHVVPETLELGAGLGVGFGIPGAGAAGVYVVGTSLALSMANFGAGLLSGRGGLAFAVGGVLAWWFVAPYAVAQGWLPGNPSGGDLFGGVYFGMLRPVGIGVLIGGALISVLLAYPALKGAIQGLRSAAKLAKQGSQAEELSPKVLGFGYAGSFLALLLIALLGSDGDVLTALALAVAGTLWLALAGLIVAQATGATDISPLSGLALIAVTIFLAISGNDVVLAITLGVAVCVATNQCADMMQDLKTGHLVGSVPRRQQLVQFGVAWIGPAIAVGTVLLLWQGGPGGANGFGPDTPLPAPQAGALEGMVNGIVQGDAPLDKYVAGAGVGAALSMFPIGGLGVLIGLAMYLPFEITLGYGIGCVASVVLEKRKGRRFYGDWIVPVGAGFIVGEALTSLTLTLVKILGGAA